MKTNNLYWHKKLTSWDEQLAKASCSSQKDATSNWISENSDKQFAGLIPTTGCCLISLTGPLTWTKYKKVLVCPHLFLVNVVVSRDDDPLLDPSFRIPSLHRLQHTMALLSIAAFETASSCRWSHFTASQSKTALHLNQERFKCTCADRPLWRGLLRRWRSLRWGWANPRTLFPGCLHAPGEKEEKEDEKTRVRRKRL